MLLAARCVMKRFPLATLIRLYKLLKNNSRFFRIADANTLKALESTMNIVVIGGG